MHHGKRKLNRSNLRLTLNNYKCSIKIIIINKSKLSIFNSLESYKVKGSKFEFSTLELGFLTPPNNNICMP